MKLSMIVNDFVKLWKRYITRACLILIVAFSFLQESELLNLQSGDTHRTIFDQCEQITRRFEQISTNFDGWSRKLRNLRDFKSQWQQFVQDARYVSRTFPIIRLFHDLF